MCVQYGGISWSAWLHRILWRQRSAAHQKRYCYCLSLVRFAFKATHCWEFNDNTRAKVKATAQGFLIQSEKWKNTKNLADVFNSVVNILGACCCVSVQPLFRVWINYKTTWHALSKQKDVLSKKLHSKRLSKVRLCCTDKVLFMYSVSVCTQWGDAEQRAAGPSVWIQLERRALEQKLPFQI